MKTLIATCIFFLLFIFLLSSCSGVQGVTRSDSKRTSPNYYYNVSTGEQGFYTSSDRVVVKYNLTEGKTELILK